MDAVVFDLDGTLVESLPGIAAAANGMLGRLGRDALPERRVRGFIGNGVPALVARCLEATGGPADGAEAIFRALYDADPVTGTEPRAGARAVLAALRGRGIRVGLCTNKPEAPARTILEALGMEMDAVVGGDTLERRKPDPAPLLDCIRRLGAAPDRTLYVGDGPVDARTARAAGIRYVFVAGGYDSGGGAEGAEARIDALPELLDLI